MGKLGFPRLGDSFKLIDLRWNTDVDVLGVDGATSLNPEGAAQVTSMELLGEVETSTISPSLGSFVGRSRLGEEL